MYFSDLNKNSLFSLIGWLLINLSLSSCSVKENRELCPCVLYFNLEQIERGTSLNLYLHNSSYLRSDTLMVRGDRLYKVNVPRKQINLNVIHSSSNSLNVSKKGKLIIPPGEDCPKVYMYSKHLEATTEKLTDTIVLHKNYCQLAIKCHYDKAKEAGYSVTIAGNVDGYDEYGKPHLGKFEYSLQNLTNNILTVNLPRQVDGSLMLKVGERKNFALGEYLLESGYDWSKLDLEDCSINIDVLLTYVTIQIDDWSRKIPIKKTI